MANNSIQSEISEKGNDSKNEGKKFFCCGTAAFASVIMLMLTIIGLLSFIAHVLLEIGKKKKNLAKFMLTNMESKNYFILQKTLKQGLLKILLAPKKI